MANIEKPIWSVDGQTLTNVLVNNKSTTYNKVSNWYDGTPMDDSKLDDDFVYVKYEGEYLVRNMEEGQVLQKDTMDDMRNLSTFETLLLKMGIYKHVQLNGYYEKGDTPEPINYKISDTVEDDDGGSVIEVGGIKLEHKFFYYVHSSYFGVIESDSPVDTRDKIQSMFNSSIKYNTKEVVIGGGEHVITPSVEYSNSDSTLVFEGSLKLEDNSISGEVQLIKYSSSNITVINQKLDGNRDNNLQPTAPRGTICLFSSYNQENLLFKGGWSKNSTQSHMHCTSDNVLIENVKFSNSGEHCLYMTTGTGKRPAEYLEIKGCEFIGWGFYISSLAITVRDMRRINISNCIFDPTYDQKADPSQAVISYTGNRRYPIQDELLYMKIDNCVFKRGANTAIATNFSILDYNEEDHLKTNYYLNRGYGIHIYNSIIDQHSFINTFKVSNCVITPTIGNYMINVPSILENNTIHHNRGIRPGDSRYETLTISNNKFMGNIEETHESSAIDLHNSDYKGTVIVSGNVFTGYNVPTNIGLIRNSTSGVSKSIITKNSFVDCGYIWTILLNGVTGLAEGNIDLSGTTRGIRFGDTFQSEYVKNNSNIKEYGDTSDRPTGDQLYEGITYYNTDINKIEIYSDGEWISLKTPASQNSASAVGDDYDKEEVQSILDELRDLKSKMRTAGLLEE